MLTTLPFNAARRHMRVLSGWGALLTVAGLLLTQPGAGPLPLARAWPGAAALPGGLGVAGPALLLGAAALLTAALVSWSRARVLAVAAVADGGDAYAARLGRRAALPSGWPQTLLALALAAPALAGAVAVARAPGLEAAGQAGLLTGGLCLLAAFPLLVLERHLAALNPAELPEGAGTAWLLRVPVAVLVAVGTALLLQSASFRFPLWIVRAAAAFTALVAAEVLLRAAAGLFLPPAPADAPRHAVRSSLARLVRAAPPSFSALGGEIERQFGIDLSRSWALGFLRRAALPALGGLAVAGWLLTGVTALRMDERAILLHLGRPAAVLQPGLHAHLPWPLGMTRKVELGVMHELPLTLAQGAASRAAPEDRTRLLPGDPARPLAGDATRALSGDSARAFPGDASRGQPGDPTRPAPPDAEAPPPASADRLWGQAHPSEAAYLVASLSQGQQSFQVVDLDLRLMFRVGASDTAAQDFAYQAEAPADLMRAAAGRVLVRYFARHTLDGVLGADRDAFAADVRGAVQADLDALRTGLELVAVVVEAVHPPPGAASAYQDVQAAELRTRELVSVQQAAAARIAGGARATTATDKAEAQAAAAETVGEARQQATLFDADRVADGRHAASFLFERRLDRLGAGLRRSQLLVLDHRLQDDTAPILDLRPSAAPPVR